MDIFFSFPPFIIDAMRRERLSKILSDAGISSRRGAEKLIQSEFVTVDEEIVTLPQCRFDSAAVSIKVHGRPIVREQKKVYYLLHKPLGYVCSNKRYGKQKIVIDLFRELPLRLFTVGRLDKDTTGLLILTNDGTFANRIIHPSSDLIKEYLVKTDKEITHKHLIRMSKGILIEDVLIRPVFVKKIRRATFKIGVKEGKKHEVRKLALCAKLNVLELKRIRIGSLQLGSLAYGQYREMRLSEQDQINDLSN